MNLYDAKPNIVVITKAHKTIITSATKPGVKNTPTAFTET